VTVLNIDDISLNAQAESDIRECYERGRRVIIPKAGELFELPYGDSRLIPQCDQWVFGIDDTTLRIKPSDFPAKGWLFVAVAFCVIGVLFFGIESLPKGNLGYDYIAMVMAAFCALFGAALAISVLRQPLDWPALLNRRTGRVVQMQGKQVVSADWVALRPFVERVYNAQGAPFWKLRLLQLGQDGTVEKDFVLKALAPGPEGCASYFEYIRRYMQGDWKGVPDTLVVSGLRRSVLRQFRNDFGWMFGKRRSWSDKPLWLKALTFMLMPILTFVIWPFGFFILLGSRAGWAPKFPGEAESQARNGVVPPELTQRIHQEPELAVAEKLLYVAIIVISTIIWAWLIFHYLGLFLASLSQV
jgi:hypothetical protein